jgi:hypothetical protein
MGECFHLIEGELDSSLEGERDIEVDIQPVFALLVDTCFVTDDGTGDIPHPFDEAIMATVEILLIAAFQPFDPFDLCVSAVIFVSDISQYRREGVLEREGSLLPVLYDIQPIEDIDTVTVFDRAKDTHSAKLVCQRFEADRGTGIKLFCQYGVAFVLLEGLFYLFLIDVAIDGKEFDQECFFVRIDTLCEDRGLIGLAGSAKGVAILGDDLASECSVMGDRCMGREVSFSGDGFGDRGEKTDDRKQ